MWESKNKVTTDKQTNIIRKPLLKIDISNNIRLFKFA